LRISIREHQPAAILDLGRRFLIDDCGKIFKELDGSDPQQLPIIRGLSYSDLDLDTQPRPPALRSAEAIAATPFGKSPTHGSIYKAAVNALLLVRRHAAALPNEQLGSIQVDREIGVTIHTVDRKQSIQMGFNDYARKLDVLELVLAFVRDTEAWHLEEIESIDLKNPDRVVVNLLREKEV
jgi:cell division protein FtsQ